MWLGGGAALLASFLIPDTAAHLQPGIAVLAGWCVVAASFSYIVFFRTRDPLLYLLNNLFSKLGALTVWAACYWSGGGESPLIFLYYFPVLYDAYFFKPRQAAIHLGANCALALTVTSK